MYPRAGEVVVSKIEISGTATATMVEELHDRTQLATVETVSNTCEVGDWYYRFACHEWVLDKDEVPKFLEQLRAMFDGVADAVEHIDGVKL